MGTPFITFLGPSNLDGYERKLPPSKQPASIPKVFLDAMEVREQVFVKEQNVPLDNEFDADDSRACHWVRSHPLTISDLANLSSLGSLRIHQHCHKPRGERFKRHYSPNATKCHEIPTHRHHPPGPIPPTPTSHTRCLVQSRRSGNLALDSRPYLYRRPQHHLPRRQGAIHKTRAYRCPPRVPRFGNSEVVSEHCGSMGAAKPHIFQSQCEGGGDGEDWRGDLGRCAKVEGFDMCAFSSASTEELGKVGI